MAKFRMKLNVAVDDLDDLDHVNNVRYVQWIQDISKAHWQATASQEMQEEFIWVVLTHHIEYKSAAVLNDPIDLSTYIEKSTGATCTRIVEMHHGETDKLIVRSATEWCLVGKKTLRPSRISPAIRRLFI